MHHRINSIGGTVHKITNITHSYFPLVIRRGQLSVQSAPRFSCCSAAACVRLRPLQLLLPGPISASAAASTAAHRLPPLPAAAPRLRPLQLLLAACVRVRFSCCSRSRQISCCSGYAIASASTAAPRLRPLQLLLPACVCWIPAHARAQCSRTFFTEFEVQ